MGIVTVNLRFAERVLIPQKALPPYCGDGIEIVTDDGVACSVHFLYGWDNAGGRYNEELDGLCRRQWGCTFELVRTLWDGRLDNLGTFWHYVELKKIDK